MTYDAIFFDVDGVLVDDSRRFSASLSRDYGLKIEDLLPFFQGVFHECLLGGADVKEELQSVCAAWGWHGTVDELMEYWLTVGTEINADVVAYVTSLRDQNLRCFIATSQEHYRGKLLQKKLGAGQPFEAVFYSAALGATKKMPAFWERAFFSINNGNATPLQKEKSLFIDDSPAHIAVAQAYGLDTYLYKGLDDLKMFLAQRR